MVSDKDFFFFNLHRKKLYRRWDRFLPSVEMQNSIRSKPFKLWFSLAVQDPISTWFLTMIDFNLDISHAPCGLAHHRKFTPVGSATYARLVRYKTLTYFTRVSHVLCIINPSGRLSNF